VTRQQGISRAEQGILGAVAPFRNFGAPQNGVNACEARDLESCSDPRYFAQPREAFCGAATDNPATGYLLRVDVKAGIETAAARRERIPRRSPSRHTPRRVAAMPAQHPACRRIADMVRLRWEMQ
jgi:hypothetical protein